MAYYEVNGFGVSKITLDPGCVVEDAIGGTVTVTVPNEIVMDIANDLAFKVQGLLSARPKPSEPPNVAWSDTLPHPEREAHLNGVWGDRPPGDE